MASWRGGAGLLGSPPRLAAHRDQDGKSHQRADFYFPKLGR